MKIDVCVITKNCERTIELCLSAIKKNIPYNRLIVIDGMSTDRTLKIAKDFGCEVFLDKGTRATARQLGIEKISTEIFAFIDGDVVIRNNWFKNMYSWFKRLKKMGRNVGAIYGYENLIPQSPARHFAYIRRKFLARQKTPQKVHFLHCGSCLILKKSISGIKIPPWLHSREDTYIAEYINSRGYEVWTVPVPFDHYCGGSWESVYTYHAASIRRLKKISPIRLLGKLFAEVNVFSPIIVIKYHQPKFMLWSLLWSFSMLRGYFGWSKYTKL